MRLRVKHFSQPNSYTCIAAAVKIILNYRKKRVSLKKVVPGVKTTKPSGADLLDAAVFCARLGTKPQLYMFDPQWALKRYQGLGAQELVKVIKRRKNEGWPWGELAELIKRGGKWHPRRRSLKLIHSCLQIGIPVILHINANHRPFALTNTVPDHPHVIVAVGFTDTHLLYLDSQGSPGVKRILWRTFSELSKKHEGEALFLEP